MKWSCELRSIRFFHTPLLINHYSIQNTQLLRLFNWDRGQRNVAC
jgi:hypothetical protein